MLTAVRAPQTLIDVFALLASDPGAVLLGGGTTIVPDITAGTAPWRQAVSLARLEAPLSGIAIRDGRVAIGATTPISALEREPALAFLRPALRAIGSPTLRNQATVGGNFFVAQPYGDLAVCLAALGAECTLIGPGGETRLAAEAVATEGRGPVLTTIAFPLAAGAGFRFRKAARRRLNSAAIVTVAAVIETAEGRVRSARIVLGGVAPTLRRAHAAEAALVGRPLDTASATAAGEAALTDADPFTDAYASAWYRARVLPVHVRRALLGED